jgi:hypothetical protein
MSSNRAVILECLGDLELSHSPSEGEPFGNLYDFLHTIPRLKDADFTSFTDLKSGQLWTGRAKEFGYTFSKRDDRKIFWKTMRSEKAFYAELNGYRLVSPFFREDQLQRPIGIDIDKLRIFYPYLEGLTVFELHFSYSVAAIRDTREDENENQHILDVILDVERRRGDEMLRAYCRSTLFTAQHSICPQDRETSLLNQYVGTFISGYKASLAACYPSGLPVIGCTVDEYLSYSFVINGYEYGNLNACLSAVNKTISPSALNNAILASGFGDGKYGNLIINEPKMGTPLHFIDFELAGLQNPFVDMCKAIYSDCFFAACCIDSLVELEKTTKTSESDCGLRIAFRVSHETREVYITHNYWTLLKAPAWDVAGISIFARRYFSVMLPLVNHLESLHGKGMTNWEQLVGHTLFSWSAFRTVRPGSPSYFYLHASIGMELFEFPHWLNVVFTPAMEKLRYKNRIPTTFAGREC